jgi:hypothetical protein
MKKITITEVTQADHEGNPGSIGHVYRVDGPHAIVDTHVGRIVVDAKPDGYDIAYTSTRIGAKGVEVQGGVINYAQTNLL